MVGVSRGETEAGAVVLPRVSEARRPICSMFFFWRGFAIPSLLLLSEFLQSMWRCAVSGFGAHICLSRGTAGVE